jgi:hypothetical protein
VNQASNAAPSTCKVLLGMFWYPTCIRSDKVSDQGLRYLSYGPPWAHYLGGYQDRLLGGPLGLPDLRCTVPDGVKHKNYKGEVLG